MDNLPSMEAREIWKIVCAMAQGLDRQKDANQIWNAIEKRLTEIMNP